MGWVETNSFWAPPCYLFFSFIVIQVTNDHFLWAFSQEDGRQLRRHRLGEDGVGGGGGGDRWYHRLHAVPEGGDVAVVWSCLYSTEGIDVRRVEHPDGDLSHFCLLRPPKNFEGILPEV